MHTIVYLLILALLGGIAMLAHRAERARWAAAQRLPSAHAAYRSALAHLKTNPTDPRLKQQALQLGRAYAAMTRQQTGVSIYDDVTLATDMSAAIAGATVMVA